MNARSRYTAFDLCILFAIITIIVATIFVVVDPAKHIHASRNSRRWSDITTIAKAIKTYEADNDQLPASIDTASGTVQILGESLGSCANVVCTGQTVAATACGIADFDSLMGAYFKKPPVDPKNGTDNNTRYYVNNDAYGIVTVGACESEGEGVGGTGTAHIIEVTQ